MASLSLEVRPQIRTQTKKVALLSRLKELEAMEAALEKQNAELNRQLHRTSIESEPAVLSPAGTTGNAAVMPSTFGSKPKAPNKIKAQARSPPPDEELGSDADSHESDEDDLAYLTHVGPQKPAAPKQKPIVAQQQQKRAPPPSSTSAKQPARPASVKAGRGAVAHDVSADPEEENTQADLERLRRIAAQKGASKAAATQKGGAKPAPKPAAKSDREMEDLQARREKLLAALAEPTLAPTETVLIEQEVQELRNAVQQQRNGAAKKQAAKPASIDEGQETRMLRDEIERLKKQAPVSEPEVESTQVLEEEILRMRMQQQQLNEQKAQKQAVRQWRIEKSLDLCFIMDCTGSMTNYIASASAKVVEIAQSATRRFPELARVRVAFVAYRDFDDGVDHFEVHEFTDDPYRIQRFVAGLQARGGGDPPEDMYGGFVKASQLKWEARTRLAIVITDAPAHGLEFHDWGPENDKYCTPMDTENMRQVMTLLRSMEIRLFFGHIADYTLKMEQQLRKLYNHGAYTLTVLPMGASPSAFLECVMESLAVSVRANGFTDRAASGY